MAEQLVRVALFTNALVSGLAVGSTILSSAINLTRDVISARAIIYQVSSLTSTADVGFFFANSLDGVTFGSYGDNAALQTSTLSTANSTGIFTVATPAILAPYVRVAVSGTGANPVDTRITASLILRMS